MFVQRHWIRQTFSYNKHFICKVLSRNNFGSQNLLICISITLIGTLCAPKKSDKLALYPYCAAWKNRCTESNRINHKQNVSALFSSALLLRRWAREIQKYVAVAAYYPRGISHISFSGQVKDQYVQGMHWGCFWTSLNSFWGFLLKTNNFETGNSEKCNF